MKKLTTAHVQLVRMLALVAVALVASPHTGYAQAVPDVGGALEATFVNNHREDIDAKVWANGLLMTLGRVTQGERRTFTLPSTVSVGTRYYLLGDCPTGDRLTSDGLIAFAHRQAHFIVGKTARQSYVRYTDVPRAAP
jgi:hypothetical protein